MHLSSPARCPAPLREPWSVSATEGWITGALGPLLAIAAMAAATYGCRGSGVVLMRYVGPPPAVRRGLAPLPVPIVVPPIVPLALRSGPAAIAGLLTGLVVMSFVRTE